MNSLGKRRDCLPSKPSIAVQQYQRSGCQANVKMSYSNQNRNGSGWSIHLRTKGTLCIWQIPQKFSGIQGSNILMMDNAAIIIGFCQNPSLCFASLIAAKTPATPMVEQSKRGEIYSLPSLYDTALLTANKSIRRSLILRKVPYNPRFLSSR